MTLSTSARTVLLVAWMVAFLAGLAFADVAEAHATSPPPSPLSTQATPTGTCPGKTKIKTRGLNPMPEMWCETSPGHWERIDPKNAGPAPGETTCPGRRKQVISPGAPMPETLCEVAPGKWVQDPTSPYKNLQQPADKDGCGFADIPCMAKKAVNGWFGDLLDSAKKPVLEFVAATVLGTPEIDSASMRRVREMWGVSQTIANTCFVLLVTVAGVLLMAGHSLSGELSPKEVLPRLVLAFTAANLSLIVIGYGISFANGLARAFLESGPEKTNLRGLATALDSGVTNVANGGGFVLLLGLVVIALAVCVALIYIMRLAITMVLIAAAPLALMFHALPMTDGLARLWWRGITGILAVQVCQSLVLVTAFHVLFTEPKDGDGFVPGIPTSNDQIDLLLAICLLLVLIRIPGWVARTVWRPAQPRLLGQVIKTFLIYRGIGALLSRAGKGAAVRSPRVRRPPTRPRQAPRPIDVTPMRVLPAPSPDDSGRPPSPPGRKAPPSAPGSPGPSRTPPERGGDVRPDHRRNGEQGEPVQLALPIPGSGKPGAKRPVQLALPIPISRVPRPPAPPPPPARPRVRSRQLMFPGMPKRPVPSRQLVLRLDPPKQSRRKR